MRAGESGFALIATVVGIGGNDLAEEAVDFGLQGHEVGTKTQTTDDVEPLRVGIGHVADSAEGGHGLDGEVVVGRGIGEAVAVEALGNDADDGDGFGVHPEGAAYDRRVGRVIVLPGFIADNGDHGGAGVVVGVGEEAAGWRLKAEGAEVVSGDEFAH